MVGSHPTASVYALKTRHLTMDQAAFFKRWEAMIASEEWDLERFKTELWTMGPRERERKGRCFADVVLDGSFRPSSSPCGSHTGGGEGEGIHRSTAPFCAAEGECCADTTSAGGSRVFRVSLAAELTSTRATP